MLAASTDIVVPFYDLDPVEIVWHGNYVKYLQVARDALMDGIGYSHEAMRASGYLWPVVEVKLRYLQAARLRQALRVRAMITDYESRLKIVYDIQDAASGRRLTRAHTIQVAVRADTGEMLFETPQVLRDKIATALKR
jgi:acyl-CoA thioester hydrolase